MDKPYANLKALKHTATFVHEGWLGFPPDEGAMKEKKKSDAEATKGKAG